MAQVTPLQKSLPSFNPYGDAKKIWANDLYSVNVTAAAAEGAANTIPEGAFHVSCIGITVDANDFVVLPSLVNVPNGHEITLLCNAGSNFELRTPASSGEKINNVDSDGTQEYLCTNARVVKIIKVSNTQGWIAYEFTNLGAVGTAVVPD